MAGGMQYIVGAGSMHDAMMHECSVATVLSWWADTLKYEGPARRDRERKKNYHYMKRGGGYTGLQHSPTPPPPP